MKRILSVLILLMFCTAAGATSIKYSQMTSGGAIQSTDTFPVYRTTAVSNAVSGTAGVVKLTVGTTTGIATNDLISVSSVGGTTEANGSFRATVIDSTHLSLQSTTFVNAYTSGGQVNFNPTVTVSNLAPLASPTFTGTLTAAAITGTSGVITSSSANAFDVGGTGATHPVFVINAADSGSGLQVLSSSSSDIVKLNGISPDSSASVELQTKASGDFIYLNLGDANNDYQFTSTSFKDTHQFILSNASTHAGQATCWTTNGQIGYCTSVVGAGGACTCTGL